GKRVLVVDWDLESPGLDRFFNPLIEPGMLDDNGGVISLIRKFEWATAQRESKADGGSMPALKDWPAEWFEDYARVHSHAFSLNWRFPGGGTLDFLPAGRQNRDYVPTLSGMNWDDFYAKRGG